LSVVASRTVLFPPILVLPGMDGTGELLGPFVAQLSTRMSVQVVTYPPGEPLGYAELIARVEAQAPNLPYMILGESFSGPIAIDIASRDPLVAGLVLASSFARHPLPSWLEPAARWIDVRAVPQAAIAAALLGPDGDAMLRARLAEVIAKVAPGTMRARASAALRVDKRRELKSIGRPVFCLAGRRDRLLGTRCIAEIQAVKPACEVTWFDAPHMLLETHAAAAAEAVVEFCSRAAAEL
jgi:pimeloyl-[acyl-carrier protein] methyl ester esterase